MQEALHAHARSELSSTARPRATGAPQKRLHTLLGIACLLALGNALLGSAVTHLRSNGVPQTILAVALVFLILLPLTAHTHSKGLVDRREALLVFYWEILFAILLPFQALVAARLHLSLQDNYLAHCDAILGVNIPAVVLWTKAHPAAAATTELAYRSLQPFLMFAILLPVITGRKLDAQRFLLGNIVAVALSLPLFALLPAIGPWTALGFVPTSAQHDCERLILAIRQPGPFLYRFGSALPIISFPSFHVIWALLSAQALWSFKFLRLPLAILATLIIMSTMTTGWHYATDVLAGIVVAAASIALAKRLCSPSLLQG